MFGKRQPKPADGATAKKPAPAAEPATAAVAAAEVAPEPTPEPLPEPERPDADALAEIAAADDDFGFDDSELFADFDDSFDLA